MQKRQFVKFSITDILEKKQKKQAELHLKWAKQNFYNCCILCKIAISVKNTKLLKPEIPKILSEIYYKKAEKRKRFFKKTSNGFSKIENSENSRNSNLQKMKIYKIPSNKYFRKKQKKQPKLHFGCTKQDFYNCCVLCKIAISVKKTKFLKTGNSKNSKRNILQKT